MDMRTNCIVLLAVVMNPIEDRNYAPSRASHGVDLYRNRGGGVVEAEPFDF